MLIFRKILRTYKMDDPNGKVEVTGRFRNKSTYQLTFTFSQSTIETLKKGVKYVQS